MRTCVIDASTGAVVNVIELGKPAFDEHSEARLVPADAPPAGFLWVPHASAGPGWTYDGEDFAPPVAPPPSLEARRRAIDTQRDATIAAGVQWDGRTWHADPVFQSQLTGILLAFDQGVLPAGATVSVRTKENTTLQLDRAQVTALAGAVLEHVQAAYAAAWQAKDQL